MKAPSIIKTLIVLLLVVTNIGCDQVSKKVVRERMNYHERIEVGTDNFVLVKVENDGAMLGLGKNLPPILKKIFLQGLPIVFLLGMLIYILINTKLDKLFIVGISFIIGGGIGNMIDRILYGSVTDFMLIDFGGWVKTGIFNAADVSVMIGTGMILLHTFLYEEPEAEPKENEVELS